MMGRRAYGEQHPHDAPRRPILGPEHFLRMVAYQIGMDPQTPLPRLRTEVPRSSPLPLVTPLYPARYVRDPEQRVRDPGNYKIGEIERCLSAGRKIREDITHFIAEQEDEQVHNIALACESGACLLRGNNALFPSGAKFELFFWDIGRRVIRTGSMCTGTDVPPALAAVAQICALVTCIPCMSLWGAARVILLMCHIHNTPGRHAIDPSTHTHAYTYTRMYTHIHAHSCARTMHSVHSLTHHTLLLFVTFTFVCARILTARV